MNIRCLLVVVWCFGLAALEEDPLVWVQARGEVRQAVTRSLLWMREQQAETGAYGSDRHQVAMTGLVLWAHVAAGITPADPECGPPLAAGLRYLLEAQDADGYFGSQDGSRMYGHAIATIALALCVGTGTDEQLDIRILEALQAAVALIERAARVEKDAVHRGGWRYQPTTTSSDLSVSAWQVKALAAVDQIGLPVSSAVIDEAGSYFLRLSTTEGVVGYTKPGEDRPSLRGGFLLALPICVGDGHERVAAVAGRMMDQDLAWRGPWFFHRAANEALALCRLRPEGWRERLETLQTILVDQQHEEGWWPKPPGDNEGEQGRIYAAALAVIALSADRFATPLFQP